jgi:hypothetical protein
MRNLVFFLLVSSVCLAFPFIANAKTEEEYQQEIRALQKRNIRLENTLEQTTADLNSA